AALRYRHLRFRRFCIKSILKGIQKSEITDCDTGGCGMWVLISYSQFPIPNSQFPIPYSLFPIPYSLFPIPYLIYELLVNEI
ncbi:hypothetical protein PN497_00495, partial [Sphaerospermopsis kisseleviana CS-549]|nr:hypothetical protein [Sphaerospermopsis kisseleviana CS-549]